METTDSQLFLREKDREAEERRWRSMLRLRSRLAPAVADAMPQQSTEAVARVVEAVVRSLINGQARLKKARERLIDAYGGAPLCTICGCPIPLDAEHDSPEEFSIDHIVPRCVGGALLGYSNLRPAHRFCNSMRHGQHKPRVWQRYSRFIAELCERYGVPGQALPQTQSPDPAP